MAKTDKSSSGHNGAMRTSRNQRGIGAMLLAMAMFSFMDTGLKLLSPHYPAIQVAAMRALSSLPLVIAYVAWRGAFGTLLQVRWPLHLLRGVLGIGMLSLFAFGLRDLPLSEAYSIVFVAPVIITILSVPILGERVERARWIAIAVGLSGVLVVLRPSGDGLFTLGGLAILGAALCYSISAITVRIVGRTDSSESQVFWVMTMVGLGAGAMAAPGWVAIRPEDAWVLLGVAPAAIRPGRPRRAGPSSRGRRTQTRSALRQAPRRPRARGPVPLPSRGAGAGASACRFRARRPGATRAASGGLARP